MTAGPPYRRCTNARHQTRVAHIVRLRLDRTAHKLRPEKSRTRRAFDAGAISEEAFERRTEGMQLLLGGWCLSW